MARETTRREGQREHTEKKHGGSDLHTAGRHQILFVAVAVLWVAVVCHGRYQVKLACFDGH